MMDVIQNFRPFCTISKGFQIQFFLNAHHLVNLNMTVAKTLTVRRNGKLNGSAQFEIVW